MLDHLHLKNFRAYSDQKFDFKRINIFIGPNNSGKSSALSALNLVAQTLRQQPNRGPSLVLNGEFEQLGTFVDTVHGNNPQTKLGISLGFDEFKYEYSYKYRTQRRELVMSNLHVKENKNQLFKFDEHSNGYTVRVGDLEIGDNQKYRLRPRGMAGLARLANRYLFHQTKDAPLDTDKLSVDSDFRGLTRALRRGDFALEDNFRDFESISPFRTPPQRTYLFTGEAPTSIGRTGEHGINMLVNDHARRGSASMGIEKSISRWLRENKIAKGLKVNSLTSRHFEICLTDFKDKEHNLCDVGFGCSQVLPVLVAGFQMSMTSERGIRDRKFLVQEPEIHLHPNAQASLGTFFVGLANSGVQLFLETHSEYLTLRIATEAANGTIAPGDVRIFYVRDLDGDKDVSVIDIDENGMFSKDFPDGFFPQRFEETKALALARQKRLKNV